MGQFFIECLSACGLAFAGILLVIAAVNSVRGRTPFDSGVGMILLCGAVISALVWTWSKIPTLEQTALYVDALAGTCDRFLTAYAFSKSGTRTDLENAALQECGRFIEAFDVNTCTRFHFPGILRWMIVPLVAVCLLSWHQGIAGSNAVAGMKPNIETDRQTRELEKIAQALELTKSDELKKIAEDIRKSEQRIKATAPDQAGKAALQEMSSLEKAVEEMMNAQRKSSPEEMAALAEGLKQSELTKDAAAALEAGKADQAAEKLEQLLHQQKGNPQLDKAGEAMRQALERLAENQKGEISKELQKSQESDSGGRKDAGTQALQRLAEMLRKAGGNAQQQNDTAGSASGQAMKSILAELQNLKYGTQQDQQSGNSKQGDGSSKVMMQSFGPGESRNQTSLATTMGPPGGTHGDQNDTGTTKDPYGPQQKKGDGTAAPTQLNGTLGVGQSLHEFMTAAGDHSQSGVQYRELYDSMLPAAEDAVMQENIPPGSRFYIKRYFQNIRPKE